MERNRKYSLFYCLLGLMLLLTQTGRAQSEIKKAHEHFRNHEFALAIAEYHKAGAGNDPSLTVAQNLAHAYRLTNNSQEAENWFAKTITIPGSKPINIYHYAEALKSNGKYAEAKLQYQAYATQAPAEAARLEKQIRAIDLALTWMANPRPVVINPVLKLNSAQSDFSPVFFDNGLLFVSDRPVIDQTKPHRNEAGWTGRPYLQLFYAKQEGDNNWAAPVAVEPAINTASHNGPATNTGTNNLIFFTRTFMQKETKKRADTDPTSWTDASDAATAIVNRLAIYSAEKRSGKWLNFRPFAFNQVRQYSVGHPALSPDGKYLYFVSDMPGGQGQTDIYYCEKRGGNVWSKPVNAGPAINTAGRESFPVVDATGTLYFSSDGHPGMGGLDLFSAKGEKAAWREITNLQAPFNSPKDDFGMLWHKSGKSGFLSSNRDATDGTDDIYSFQMKE